MLGLFIVLIQHVISQYWHFFPTCVTRESAFKGAVTRERDWLKVQLLDRSILGTWVADGFWNFIMLLWLITKLDPNMPLQRKGIKISPFLPIAATKCSWRLLDSCWALPKGIGKDAQRLLDSPLAILRGYWKAGKCPSTHCQPIGEKEEYQQKMWQFPLIFSEVLHYV